MNVSERLAAAAVVPVVVLDDTKDAVPTAKALLAGGVDVMEITFRTAAAADSIKVVAESCPDMLVGAGTTEPEASAQAEGLNTTEPTDEQPEEMPAGGRQDTRRLLLCQRQHRDRCGLYRRRVGHGHV